MSVKPVLDRIDHDLDQAIERLKGLLRIPSISTDPAYKEDCKDAAEWLVRELRSLGVNAESRPTSGHPMVVGHVGDSGPRLVFYGHYDVQPVDPLDLWKRPPFEPTVEDTVAGKVIRGRGAADDKGQLMTFIEACRAWKEVHGCLPARITFLLEGEEESQSPSLIPFMKENAAELTGDIALICDTGMFDQNTPSIITSLRGLLGEEVTIIGPDKDLHSGLYGGAAINPIRVLSRIISGLHDDTGRITLPDFYRGVPETDPAILAQWEALGFDEEAFLGDVGLSHPAGEQGRTTLEMTWSRPTCEVNGIWGGYTGDGFKTVLPSKAHTKISFRLVGTQDPEKIRETFRAYVQAMLPPDCRAEFKEHGAAPASQMTISDPAFERARQALSEEWPNEAAFIGGGGSIPIAGYFKEILNMDAMLIGFGHPDDMIHSPNEKYDLRSFHKGIRSWARVLDALNR